MSIWARFPPGPSSFEMFSIGGNVAINAGACVVWSTVWQPITRWPHSVWFGRPAVKASSALAYAASRDP